MWNNLDYASEKLNNCEHFRIHKEHLERLIQAKPAIENSPPLKPFFIYDKASKREERRQELEKINYQNKILIERIDSIGRKPSPYSNCMLKPSIFPALNKSKGTYNDKKKQFDIIKSNKFLFLRFQETKPHYSTKSFIKSNNEMKQLKEIRKKNISNPNLNYSTFENFRKKLYKQFLDKTHVSSQKNISSNKSVISRTNSCIGLGKNPEIRTISSYKDTPSYEYYKTKNRTENNQRNWSFPKSRIYIEREEC